MTTELTITTERTGAQAQLGAEGEIDLSTVGELREAVLAAAQDAERVLLDLTRLDFVDTTGLGCLLELRSTLHGRGVLFQSAARAAAITKGRDTPCC